MIWAGQAYRYGFGVIQDTEEAIKCYKIAAEGGDDFAMGVLGSIYEEGEIVPQDKEEAIKWHKLAVDKSSYGKALLRLQES